MPATFDSLPQELVRRVFTVGPKFGRHAAEDDEWTVLSLRDRCRGQAVCRAWRDWLSPRSLPLKQLELGNGQGLQVNEKEGVVEEEEELKRCVAFAQWVSHTQPTVRRIYLNLSGRTLEPSDPLVAATLTALASIQPREAVEAIDVEMDCPLASWFLPVLRLFPRVRKLQLLCDFDNPVLPLDVAILCGLPHLADLWVEQWEHAFFTQAFTALTTLELRKVGEVVLDTELPRLVHLEVSDAREARLCGERLRLPQLACLEVSEVEQAEVDWSAMPVLEDLTVQVDSLECPEDGSFSSLTRLSSLDLCNYYEGNDAAVQNMAGLLRLAPPSLRSMSIGGSSTDGGLAVLAACGKQLTSLYCRSAEIVPALGPLRQLEELEVHATAAELAGHCAVLGGLPRLRKLTCGKKVLRDEMKGADWKRLVSALPKGCVVEERSCVVQAAPPAMRSAASIVFIETE